MAFDNLKENYLLYGVSYSEAEVLKARGIRDLPDNEKTSALITAFEKETGKTFPVVEPVEFGFNPDTACLSSLEIQRGAEWIIAHPLESRY